MVCRLIGSLQFSAPKYQIPRRGKARRPLDEQEDENEYISTKRKEIYIMIRFENKNLPLALCKKDQPRPNNSLVF